MDTLLFNPQLEISCFEINVSENNLIWNNSEHM